MPECSNCNEEVPILLWVGPQGESCCSAECSFELWEKFAEEHKEEVVIYA